MTEQAGLEIIDLRAHEYEVPELIAHIDDLRSADRYHAEDEIAFSSDRGDSLVVDVRSDSEAQPERVFLTDPTEITLVLESTFNARNFGEAEPTKTTKTEAYDTGRERLVDTYVFPDGSVVYFDKILLPEQPGVKLRKVESLVVSAHPPQKFDAAA